LKPGGRLVIVDVDYRATNLVYPVKPTVTSVLEKAARLHQARGGDPYLGSRIWRLLDQAGFDNLDLEAVPLHSGERGLDWCAAQIDADRLRPFVDAGLLSEAELEQVRTEVDGLLIDPEAFYLSVMLLGAGRKPS
jgi:hypothetical protein